MKYILDRNPDLLSLLKSEIVKFVEKNLDKYTLLILNARKHNLLLFDVNIFEVNNLNNKTTKYYGIKLDNQYLYFNKSWIVINKELVQKYEKSVKIKEFNNIYGFIEKKELKILDNSKFKKAYTTNYKESKRSIITGRRCNTYKIEELKNLLKNINNKLDEKNKKNMCMIIELELRKLNIKSDKIYFFE